MSYMRLENHSPAARLSTQETVYIRHEAAARKREILAAAATLHNILSGTDTTSDMHEVLARFSAPSNLARIPRRFTTARSTVRLTSTRSKQHDRVFYRETHNKTYTRRLRRQHCRQRKASVIEDHYFQVPTSPLPLSYAAQRDSEWLRGSQRRRRGPTGSGYAPLFSKASTSPLASRELSPVEQEALRFLTPPKQNRKLEGQTHYTRSDPKARALFNEPKKMPNLHRRVPADFKAECVEKPTCSFSNHCEGNEARVQQNATSTITKQWH